MTINKENTIKFYKLSNLSCYISTNIKQAIIFVVFWMIKSVQRAIVDIKKKKTYGGLLIIFFALIFWKISLSAALLWVLFFSFLFYKWENRVIIALALLCLIICPFLLAGGKQEIAEIMAVYAYYFLAMGVILQIIEFKQNPDGVTEKQISPVDAKLKEKIKCNINDLLEQQKLSKKNSYFSKSHIAFNVAVIVLYFFIFNLRDLSKQTAIALTAVVLILTAVNLLIFMYEHHAKTYAKIKQKIKNSKILIFFIGIAFIFWQMLKPGYILTQDMIFAPNIKILHSPNGFYNDLPIKYLMKFLNLFMEGWVIQKIMLIALFFCIGYFAFKFLPVPKKFGARYWACLFYTVNPFVYERFLAGHWMHLFAYAFLPPFILCLLRLVKKPKIKKGLKLFFWLFLIGMFSLHFLVMAVMILFGYIFYTVISAMIKQDMKKIKKILKCCLIGGSMFLLLSFYWIAPYATRAEQSVVNTFTKEHWDAFKTADDARLGVEINVLALYGFWGEREPWADYFLWPKDNFALWTGLFILLIGIITIGLADGLKNRKTRKQTIFFAVLGLFGFIFSCGLSETIFKSLNLWLFENIGIWRGFRDTQKFSGLLVLVYAYFGGLGFVFLAKFAKEKATKILKLCLLILFLIPVFYAYPMLGGFARQIEPVQYPQSWQEANQILNNDDDDFKVLFLPWHQYFSLNFNKKLITANPAKLYFDKEIVQSYNMELGKIVSQEGHIQSEEIERIIASAYFTPDEKIKFFNNLEIKYIIFTDDLIDNDIFEYEFLKSDLLDVIYQKESLTLYKIVL
ncbi:hypothetical protein KAJ61_04040 [Candidatus Parcubacteria bacterium]|nr:hypothetical protein [Candidatus Parcubacteria bacterium]